MTSRDPAELNRLKQARRNAILNLAAKRMGFPSWSTFGKQFSEALACLPTGASETDVNLVINSIMANAVTNLLEHKPKKTADTELSAVFKAHPRLRKWNVKKTA